MAVLSKELIEASNRAVSPRQITVAQRLMKLLDVESFRPEMMKDMTFLTAESFIFGLKFDVYLKSKYRRAHLAWLAEEVGFDGFKFDLEKSRRMNTARKNVLKIMRNR